MPAPTQQFKRYGMIILVWVVALQSVSYYPSIYYDYVDLFSYYYTKNTTDAASLNTTKTVAEEGTSLQPATSSEEVNTTKWNALSTNKTAQIQPLYPATVVEAINKPKPNVTLTFKKRRFDVSITYNYQLSRGLA